MKLEIFLGRTFLIVLSIVGSFFVFEIFSRPYLPTRSPFEQNFPSGSLRVPRPYVMFGGAPNFNSPNLKLNTLGYRGPIPASNKPLDEFRIIMLGGSTVFNGSPPIPTLLEEELKSQNLNGAKVYNFGVVSSVSGMELARLAHEVSGLSPDLVIAYGGGNDILHPFSYDPRPGYPFNFISFANNPLQKSNISQYPLMELILYGSNLARKFFRNYFLNRFAPIQQIRTQAGYGTDSWKMLISDTYVSNLEKMAKISKAFDADFLAFFQPLAFFKENLTKDEQRFSTNKPQTDHALAMQEIIRNRIKASKVLPSQQVIDLSDFFKNEKAAVFTDIIHILQEKKPAIAQAIAEQISRERLKVKKKKKKEGEQQAH